MKKNNQGQIKHEGLKNGSYLRCPCCKYTEATTKFLMNKIIGCVICTSCGVMFFSPAFLKLFKEEKLPDVQTAEDDSDIIVGGQNIEV